MFNESQFFFSYFQRKTISISNHTTWLPGNTSFVGATRRGCRRHFLPKGSSFGKQASHFSRFEIGNEHTCLPISSGD
jgi:hypothetical protein